MNRKSYSFIGLLLCIYQCNIVRVLVGVQVPVKVKESCKYNLNVIKKGEEEEGEVRHSHNYYYQSLRAL